MSETIKHVKNLSPCRDFAPASCFGQEQAQEVQKFHQSIPGYKPTSLQRLESLAETLGLASFCVKDESSRFGLNAFKGLGGSYAIGRVLAERLGISENELTFQRLQADDVKEARDGITFVTATDGNHGRGIAWFAGKLGLDAVVYMPKGSAQERLLNIQRLGARAEITDMNYDETVRFAASCEHEHGWILMQDTAWEGYEKIPKWIMQGYTTMAIEAVEQLKGEIPTHIFLQAGVGAMSGAMAAFFADFYRDKKPVIIIAEPNQADCIYQTAKADDGRLHSIRGDLDSIMAGLACGEPCTIGWKMLRMYADCFVSIPDYVAANGMRILGNPLDGDARIVSGESGAATTGLVAQLMKYDDFFSLRQELGLGKESRVLCISTEGDTDRNNYRKIVWSGAYADVREL